MMSVIALGSSVYLLLVLGDRMRSMNWLNIRPLFMVMYLGHVFWIVGLMWEAVNGQIRIYQLCALAAMICWVRITRSTWRRGVPDAMKTDVGKLDALEARRWPE